MNWRMLKGLRRMSARPSGPFWMPLAAKVRCTGAEAILLVGDGAGQDVARIRGAVVAVVEEEHVVGQVDAGLARHFHELVGVVALVVVVEFVDPHIAGRTAGGHVAHGERR
jgi:hypothetical protein